MHDATHKSKGKTFHAWCEMQSVWGHTQNPTLVLIAIIRTRHRQSPVDCFMTVPHFVYLISDDIAIEDANNNSLNFLTWTAYAIEA